MKSRGRSLAGDVLIVAAEQVALLVDDHRAATRETTSSLDRHGIARFVGDLTAKAKANGIRLR
jgi:hypothetical protein